MKLEKNGLNFSRSKNSGGSENISDPDRKDQGDSTSLQSSDLPDQPDRQFNQSQHAPKVNNTVQVKKEKRQNFATSFMHFWKGANAMMKTLVMVCLLAVLIGCGYFAWKTTHPPKRSPELTLHSTLQKIQEQSELHTLQTTWNGIAHPEPEKEGQEPDYYVNYVADIICSVDFEQVQVKADEAEHTITLTIPKPNTEIRVRPESLEFIWRDSKANKQGVTADAAKLCEASLNQKLQATADYDSMTISNAKSFLRALTKPFENDWTIKFAPQEADENGKDLSSQKENGKDLQKGDGSDA